MSIEIDKIYKILDEKNVISDKDTLFKRYCDPIAGEVSKIPLYALLPENAKEISELIKYFRTIKNLNVVITSSRTNPKFLDDTIIIENTVVLDLFNMRKIPFIDKRNRVCVVEPGVTWTQLATALERKGLRPLAPFVLRPWKSALASVLDREPHMITKKQFDISDPLLCMEVVFGNGEIFRTGEAAGPLSIEENRKAGAALTNPLGPGQSDIFRIIQGSKGTLGCVTWISMQCDLIPKMGVIKIINSDNLEILCDFVYESVRKRLIDEVILINQNLYKSLFPYGHIPQEFALIFAINGYEWLPDEKVAYQTAEVHEICEKLCLTEYNEQDDHTLGVIKSLFDGYTFDPYPKYEPDQIAVDLIYTTTLDRVHNQIKAVEKILESNNFPLNRLHTYIQPIIQARAASVEITLMADRTDNPYLDSYDFPIIKVNEIIKAMAKFISEHGGFFSRSYRLINEFAFNDKNQVFQESLRKIKRIFDPDHILNRGQLIF